MKHLALLLAVSCLPALAQIPTCAGPQFGQTVISDTIPNPISALPFSGTMVVKNTAVFWISNQVFASQACSIRITAGTFSVAVNPGTYVVTVTPDSAPDLSWSWYFNITAQTPNPSVLANVVNGPMLPSPGMFVSLSSLSFAGAAKGSLIAGCASGWGLLAIGTDGFIPYADSTKPCGLRWGAAPTGGGGGGGGTVTTVSLSTIPSWFTAAVVNQTTTPDIQISATSAQTPHSVIGTCGTATSFAPCALVAGDLPAVPLTSGVSGILPIANGGSGTATPSLVAISGLSIGGTWPNQTIGITGAVLPILNGGTGTTTPGLVAGTNVTITGSWPTQTINSTGGGGGGGASSVVQLSDFAATRNSNTVLTIGPPSTSVACGDKYYLISTTATVTLGASSAATGSQGWISVNCATGTLQMDTNANFTQANITPSNVNFGSSAASGFPAGNIPLFQVFAGDTALNQWNTSAFTDYRSLFRAQRVNVGNSGNLTKTVDPGGNTVLDCPNCGTSTFSTTTLKFATAALTIATGTGTNHTVFSWTVPGNTIGAGDCISLDLALHAIQSGGTTSPLYVAWGATNVQVGALGTANTGEYSMQVELCNNPGVTNAQQIFVRYATADTGVGTQPPTRTTTSLDTTQPQTLAFLWGDGFGANQSVNLDMFRVKH